MCAAMRRRQPRDRIDYDFACADNEPVTRTGGPPGADRSAEDEGATVPVSTFPPIVIVRCCSTAEGEDLFKAIHSLYLSSGERRDG